MTVWMLSYKLLSKVFRKVFPNAVRKCSINCRFVPESPRWLLSHGKIKGAEYTMMIIGRRNGVSKDKLLSISLSPPKLSKQTHTLFDLFKYPVLRMRTMLMIYGW